MRGASASFYDSSVNGKPDFDVAIIGAGFSGLGMAIRLKQQGKRSFVVLEKADAVGGTWRENRYPGCACDIQSNLYSFSFASNPNWSRLYPPQQEIWDYLEACADKFGVRGNIRFGARLKRAAWDDAAKFWRVETADGRTLTARAVVSGMGGLHVPNMPEFPGLDAFKGRHWHSARWPENADLADRRVAMIGSGASAVQIAPQIAPVVAHLDLYQRTPSWIVPKNDRAVGDGERRAFTTMPFLQELKRRFVYGVNEARVKAFLQPRPMPGLAEGFARKHIERQIADPVLREKVTPTYRLGCKRVLISDDFYPALQRDNVSLITHAAQRITETGVVDSEGVERPADVIVFATGFKPMALIDNVEITGVGGRSLNAEWRNGPEAYLATVVSGYPNFFMLLGPNSALGHNSVIYMIESQIAYVLDALDAADAHAAAALDVKADVQRAFNADIEAKLGQSIWASGCASWYLSADGKNRTLWPDYTFKFRERTKRVNMADFELVT